MFVPVVFWGVWVGQPGGRWTLDLRRADQPVPLSQVRALHRRHLLHHRRQGPHAVDRSRLHLDRRHRRHRRSCTPPTSTPIRSTAPPPTPPSATAARSPPTAASSPAANAVFVTHDHGATWTRAAEPRHRSPLRQRARRAVVGPGRVRDVGVQAPPYAPTLHRSTDGGGGFTTTPLTYQLDGVDPHGLELLAVDPRTPTSCGRAPSPRCRRRRRGDAPRAAALRRRRRHLERVYEARRRHRGVGPDPRHRRHRLRHDRQARLRRHAHGPARRHRRRQRHRADARADRHAGADPVRRRARRRRSTPARRNFRPTTPRSRNRPTARKLLTRCSTTSTPLGPVDCPAGTPVGDLCPSYWYMYGAQLGISFDGGMRGSDAAPMPPKGGCGCTVGAVGSAAGGIVFACCCWRLAR